MTIQSAILTVLAVPTIAGTPLTLREIQSLLMDMRAPAKFGTLKKAVGALVAQGLVERVSPGHYRLTAHGRLLR